MIIAAGNAKEVRLKNHISTLIREVFAKASVQCASMFPFNGMGACPACGGRGQPLSTLSGGERQRVKLAKGLGGDVVFTGTPEEMIAKADTITARFLRESVKRAEEMEQ